MSGSGDKTVRVWDMAEQVSCKIRKSPVSSLREQSKEAYASAVSIDNPIKVNAGVTSVRISPDGTLVAAGSLDTAVRVWDVQTGKLVEQLEGHGDSIYSVAFTPDGRGLVSGSLDRTLKYWDMQNAAEHCEDGLEDSPSRALDKTSLCTMNVTGHDDYVLCVEVSHDGQ